MARARGGRAVRPPPPRHALALPTAVKTMPGSASLVYNNDSKPLESA
jgi:hypothetical protein